MQEGKDGEKVVEILLMIIDAHTHIFPDEVRKKRQYFCRKDEGFRILYGNERSKLAGKETLLDSMNQEGVSLSFVCGFPWKDAGLCREHNNYLLHFAREHPGRSIPFCAIPLGSVREAKKELQRCLSLGMRGVGELSFYCGGMRNQEIKFLRSALRPIQETAIPVLLHTNEPVGHLYPGKTPSDLRSIYDLLSVIPRIPFILAHWGGGFLFYELMPEIGAWVHRIYYDTAASPYLYRPQIYSLAIQIAGMDRILWGSDFPLIPPRRYFVELEGAGLPLKVQDQIKGLNAHRLVFPSDPCQTGAHDDR